MTLRTHIVTTQKPTTKREIRAWFNFESRFKTMIKGKKLLSFSVERDAFASDMDPYTSYHNVYASHYDIIAVFQD